MTALAQSSDDDQMARVSKVAIADVSFLADLSGALFWQEQSLLVVSDLHLEKGSSFAARGVLLPPYDTVATLSRLAAVIARHDPRMVIALGDSFHDRNAHERLSAPDREALRRCRCGATGSGFPAITIRRCRRISAAWSRMKSRSAASCSAMSRRALGRNRRPSAPQGPRRHPRPRHGAAMFCLRRRARRDARIRRLHRWAEHPRSGVRENLPHARPDGACARRQRVHAIAASRCY